MLTEKKLQANTDLKITKDNNYICVYERLNDDCIRLLHMYGKNPVCVYYLLPIRIS